VATPGRLGMDPGDRKIEAPIATFDQEHDRAQRAISALSHAGK